MPDSYPNNAAQVKPVAPSHVQLSLCLNTVPQAYIPLPDVARVLGVSMAQAADWCHAGSLAAVKMEGLWWVTAADLTAFVSQCRWRLEVIPGRVPVPDGL